MAASIKLPELPSLSTASDERFLYRYLSEMHATLEQVKDALDAGGTDSDSATALTSEQLSAIRSALSARGTHPLPLDGLRGQPADAQIGGVLVVTTLPPAQAYAAYTEVLLLSGGRYTRYFRSASGTPTWVSEYGSLAVTNADNAFSILQSFNAGIDMNSTSIVDILSAAFALGHGASMTIGAFDEEITLSTSGATTDSTNSLPGSSLILPVLQYITQTISGGGVASFQLGDPTTAGRFHGADVNLAAGNGRWSYAHWSGVVTTEAAGPTQLSSAKARVTCSATPTQGKVRIVVPYVRFSVPTS